MASSSSTDTSVVSCVRKRENSFAEKKVFPPKQTNLTDNVHDREHRQSLELLSSTERVRIFALRRTKPTCITTENWIIQNVTSTSKDAWCLELSPFFLGPIELYENPETGKPFIAQNMENAWQFCKVYSQFANSDDQAPTEAYWTWARKGWHDSKAHRFPLGRTARKPLYSLWKNQRLGYIEARKQIYAPLYAKYVELTDGYKKLNEIYRRYCCAHESSKDRRPMALVDFDGWDHLGQGYSLDEVIDLSKPKMGHAFVLAGLLENNLFWLSEPEKSRVEQARRDGLLLKDISA